MRVIRMRMLHFKRRVGRVERERRGLGGLHVSCQHGGMENFSLPRVCVCVCVCVCMCVCFKGIVSVSLLCVCRVCFVCGYVCECEMTHP